MKGKLGEPYQQACKSLYVPFCPSQARDLCLRVLREERTYRLASNVGDQYRVSRSVRFR
jgi:hypothetical protein